MKLSIIGTGYVGLVSGVCFAELGFDVTCIDRDTSKIDTLKSGGIPIWEPGLEELVASNAGAGRLHFTENLEEGILDTDVIFVAVGTPPIEASDFPDLSALEAVFDQLKNIATPAQLIVIKSTVPVGTTLRMQQLLEDAGCQSTVASNPEFLREGSAIQDFMESDRVVAGVSNARDKETITKLYQPLTDKGAVLFLTTPQSSELIKYTANSLLALRVAYINEIADICERMGANVRDVAKGIGLDHRIGYHFLKPGPGIGGSCFPKDTQALTALARDSGAPATIIEAAIQSNNIRKQRMVTKVIEAAGGSVDGKTIGILGLTFKPKTDDMRESPSIDIIHGLQEAGARIQAYDPEGMEQAKVIFNSPSPHRGEARRGASNAEFCEGRPLPNPPPKGEGIKFVGDAYEAAKDADILVVITEWQEFETLDLTRIGQLMKQKLIVDLRNIFKRQDMINAGFTHISVGREPVKPGTSEVKDLLAV